jgi:hypothetical protein
MIPDRVRARFWSSVEVRGPDDCWPWLLSTGSHGYGQVGWAEGGRTVTKLAHRVAWELENGPIPDGMTVGHRHDLGCLSRICCNTRHMLLLTNEENGRDNGNLRKTECKRSHPLDEVNTYVDPSGHRRCRQCRREGYPMEAS